MVDNEPRYFIIYRIVSNINISASVKMSNLLIVILFFLEIEEVFFFKLNLFNFIDDKDIYIHVPII